MTTTTAAPEVSTRSASRAAGILYLITFASIPTLGLYAAIDDPEFILGTGSVTPVILGTVLELIVALACIGTAVALFPVLRRQNESLALGLVGARVLEAGTIFAGVVMLLSLITLREAGVGEDGLITSQALVAQYEWFRLGQGLMPVVNAVLLGTLLYRSRLVPRVLPIIAFVGAPLLLVSDLAIMFGVIDAHAPIAGLAALPIAVWELSLGIYLVARGFKSNSLVD
jgi:hypothetical protein